MKAKVAFFLYRRDLGAILHALRYAQEARASGGEVRVVLEDKATALLFELTEPVHAAAALFEELVREKVIVVCRACAAKTETLSLAENRDMVIEDACEGHVPVLAYVESGFTIIT
ncbi:MAG TPA: hypothetical protein PKH10_11835, partial [bacterium]|nr:hypothetical protein [bacterium]